MLSLAEGGIIMSNDVQTYSLEYAVELFSELTESEKLYIIERIQKMLEEKQDK